MTGPLGLGWFRLFATEGMSRNHLINPIGQLFLVVIWQCRAIFIQASTTTPLTTCTLLCHNCPYRSVLTSNLPSNQITGHLSSTKHWCATKNEMPSMAPLFKQLTTKTFLSLHPSAELATGLSHRREARFHRPIDRGYHSPRVAPVCLLAVDQRPVPSTGLWCIQCSRETGHAVLLLFRERNSWLSGLGVCAIMVSFRVSSEGLWISSFCSGVKLVHGIAQRLKSMCGSIGPRSWGEESTSPAIF